MTAARRVPGLFEAIGATALILLLARPLIFGGSDRGQDFYTHYWYVWHQAEALRDGGPSLWLHNTSGVFSAFYAFYGGTLYVLVGALAVLLGSPLTAYVLSFVLAFAASYGGWWWLSRQAGLRGLVAHAPGVVSVTSAYAITRLYVSGGWAEHVAVSTLPLLVASALSVLRADRLRALPALALAGSALVFTGSHNLSLLYGATVLAATAVALALLVPGARRLVTRAGVLRLLAVVVPAVLVNMWFLVPDLVYGSKTNISALRPEWELFLRRERHYVDLRHLLALDRGTVDPSKPHASFALPVAAMAWTLVAAAVARPRWRDPWLRALIAVAAVGAAVLVGMTQVGLLRGPFTMIQFSFRLESYVDLMVSAGVLIGLVLVRDVAARPRARGLLHAALGLIAVASVVAASAQSVVHRDPSTYDEWHAFPSYYTKDIVYGVWDYAQANEPYLEDEDALPHLTFPPQAIEGGRVSAAARVAPGSAVLTNVAGLWPLLDLRGGRFVGLGPGGRAIVQVEDATITVAARTPPAFAIGRLLSFAGLLGLAAVAATIALRARRRRRDRPDPAAPEREEAVVGAPTAV